MNDTHGVQGEGWIGFDLDGTLAIYEKWKGIDHIGDPVPAMVHRIKVLNAEGKRVKILTARVAPRSILELDGQVGIQGHYVKNEQGVDQWLTADYYICKWCEKNLGFVPEITHEKDHLMITLYDDRVKQVIPNNGTLVEEDRDCLCRWYREALDHIRHLESIVDNIMGPEKFAAQKAMRRNALPGL